MDEKTTDGTQTWAAVGSIGAAIAAAACCLGPVVLVSLGVGGAWVGNLSALEPYSPLFMVVAAGFLVFGHYQVYGQSNDQDCGEGAECDVPRASLTNQISLWAATVVVVGLFGSPYLLSLGLDDAAAESTASGAKLSMATLTVDGMTCGGCVRTVDSTLSDIDGVEDARVTLEPPRANVTYDASRVSVEKLTRATGNVGFPSEPAR